MSKLSVLKHKVLDTKYNFAKNFYYHAIAPLVAIVLGLILFLTIGFNYGIDFAGGTVATVVVEQDLSVNTNYVEVKKQVDTILKDNGVCGISYQITETNYYGNAITVKFETSKFTNHDLAILQDEIKEELITEFYPTVTDVNDLNTFVKVESFGGSVANSTIIRVVLAAVLALVVAFIYISSRFGLTAGFTAVAVGIIDCLTVFSFVCIFRLKLEQLTLSVLVLTVALSVIYSVMNFSRIKENLAKQKYDKVTNQDFANIIVKENMKKTIIISLILLGIMFLLTVLPLALIERVTFPALISVIVCLFSSMFIAPGVWAMAFVRKVKKNNTKEEEQVVIENPTEESSNIEDAPEVIVEEEAKSDI